MILTFLKQTFAMTNDYQWQEVIVNKIKIAGA